LGVVVLGEGLREADTLKALEAGADFYLVKPFSTRELFARVQVMLRPRPIVQAQDVLNFAGITMSLTSHRVSVRLEEQEVAITLSPTAFKLLRLFMTHPGEVLSRDTILRMVWMGQTDARKRAADVHVKFLRDALRPFDTKIETVWNGGYRLSSANALSASLAIRYNFPDIGRRLIDKNVSMHAAIFVQDQKDFNNTDNSGEDAFQQSLQSAHIRPVIRCKSLFGSHHRPVIRCRNEPAKEPRLTGPFDRGEIQRKRKPPFSLLLIREPSA
jgi:DNA-binding winged helix-turn-helix (wHTH) protein